MHANTSSGTSWPISSCLGVDEHVPILGKIGPDPKSGKHYDFSPIIILNTTRNFELDLLRNSLKDLKSKSKGLWTTVYDDDGRDLFAASVCWFNVHWPQRYQVDMSGKAILSEPTNISEIHLQLEPTAPPQKGRDILNLETFSHIKDDQGTSGSSTRDPTYNATLHEYPSDSKSAWNMMFDGESDFRWRAHRDHGSLFQSIIKEKGNPTFAIQALGTRIHQMIYYDWLQDYDRQFSVRTVHATQRLVPGGWVGLIFVLTFIWVHLGLVFSTVTLFIRKTRVSALGNAWQAAAQTAHMAGALESADSMLDKEVGKWAKSAGLHKEMYALSESDEGRIEMQLCKRA